jgi:hypothetical protein
MKLYIQVENGQTVNHPAFEDNLLQAFGQIPSNWEPFIRVQRPVLGVYEVFETNQPTYQKIDGVWTDVWASRQMTQVEKQNKQQSIKDDWANDGFASWIFSEEKCLFEPPIAYPSDGKSYRWDEPTTSWKLVE